MATISAVLLSGHSDKVEAARVLLEEYLRLADGWARGGGVPVRLPASFEQEITAFPGHAVPPGGDVIVGIGTSGNIVAAGHVVGLESSVCEFKRLYVRPDDRRRGVAKRVAGAMIDRGRALGYRRAVLDVMPERTAAIAFWAGLGFRPCPPFHTYAFPMESMDLDLEPRAG